MRILPRAQREAMFEIYSFCRAVDDIADDPGPREPRRAQLDRWRTDIDAVYRGAPPPQLSRIGAGGAHIRPATRGFHRHHRWHGNGCRRRHPRPRPRHARSLLRPRRLRGRPPVGAGIRHGASTPVLRLPITSAARFSSPTFCATSTRMLRSAASICRERLCTRPALMRRTRPRSSRIRRSAKFVRQHCRAGESRVCCCRCDHEEKSAPCRACAADHGRGLLAYSSIADCPRLRAAARGDPPAARKTPVHRAPKSRVIG